jgi:DNA-directed RNA polymerase subunit RPC12/RpoP
MTVAYIYKTIECKGCGSQVEIEYLGPALNLRIAGVVRNPGQVRCPKCGESHKYIERDMQFAVRDHSPDKRRK